MGRDDIIKYFLQSLTTFPKHTIFHQILGARAIDLKIDDYFIYSGKKRNYTMTLLSNHLDIFLFYMYLVIILPKLGNIFLLAPCYFYS